MTLYVLTGVPASGKSSVAREIADFLNVELISKDIEQVALFEKYGFRSREEKLKLVKEADKIVERKILQSVNDNSDVVLDKYVRDEAFFQKIKQQGLVKVVYIYIYADAEIICNRYNRRTVEERPLCMDVMDKYPYIEGESHIWPPMTVGKIAEMLDSVQTPSCVDIYEAIDSSLITCKELVSKVKVFLERI